MNNPMSLEDRVIVITGAAQGIGRGVATAAAALGARLVLVDINGDGLKETAELLGGGIDTYAGSVADAGFVQQTIDDVIAKHGVINGLFNNAGIIRTAMIHKMSIADWQAVIDVNLTGQFLCARAAIREFKKRGVVADVSCSAGKIICMSSVHEIIPWAGHVNYAASKGGVMLMMKSIAQEVAPFRIRVNSICPGAIRTPINRDAWETQEAYDSLMNLIPYRRIGEPEDIGKAAAWLASDQADYVNGTSMVVDGGMCLYPGFATGG